MPRVTWKKLLRRQFNNMKGSTNKHSKFPIDVVNSDKADKSKVGDKEWDREPTRIMKRRKEDETMIMIIATAVTKGFLN